MPEAVFLLYSLRQFTQQQKKKTTPERLHEVAKGGDGLFFSNRLQTSKQTNKHKAELLHSHKHYLNVFKLQRQTDRAHFKDIAEDSE